MVVLRRWRTAELRVEEEAARLPTFRRDVTAFFLFDFASLQGGLGEHALVLWLFRKTTVEFGLPE